VIVSIHGKQPNIAPDVYIAPGAVVIGDVEIGAGASVWFNAVLRGDVERIRIGAGTNIQDNATVHVTSGTWPTTLGAGVTVGHAAVVHGGTVGDHSLIGIGAIVLDGVVIGSECLVGAGALLPPGMQVPARSVVLGNPGKVVRPLRPEELERLRQSARSYVEYARAYRAATHDG
jgi:carbonic anhydrase/acetyltransferase-like protein (isoleucine patch superfamily)